MVTLIWNAEDIADVHASLFRKGTPYQYMEMPRNILGCIFADKVTVRDTIVGISTSRCYSYYFREMLSLCVLDVALTAPGNAVTVVWGRDQGCRKNTSGRRLQRLHTRPISGGWMSVR